MILSEKIEALRRGCGWSQEGLADQMGVSRQSVSKWESGASIPDLDKVLRLARLFGVSTDYLLLDEMEAPAGTQPDAGEELTLTAEMANEYMALARGTALPIALAVALLILSPICLILLGGLSEYIGLLGEGLAGGLGVGVLLVLVAAAVAVFILCGTRLEPWEWLEKEPFTLQYGVQGIVEKRRAAFAPTWRGCLAGGVCLCILGIVPLVVAGGMGAGDLVLVGCVCGLLAAVAVAVGLFVWSGSIWECYQKLLQQGEYTPAKKEAERRAAWFAPVYWCCVTALYLAVSFATNRWDATWPVWPVAGVLFVAVQALLESLTAPQK